MKTLKGIGTFTLTVILLLCVSHSSYGQSRQDKTNAIIKELKLTEPHKINYEYRVKPLKYHATGVDSMKLVDMEKQFTDENILKVISGAFDDVLSDDELNQFYSFMQTSVYEKLFNPGILFKVISEHFNDIDKEIDRISNSLKSAMEVPVFTFEPIPVDREDGFYATVDYNRSMKDKDVQLEPKPSLTSKDILEVKREPGHKDIQEVSIQFTKEGAQKLYLLTKNNRGKPLAIVIAKQIVSMPTINDAIMGGRANITGHFTDEEVAVMIARLKEKE